MKENIEQSERITDERIAQVTGNILDAITCDSSVNALILTARKEPPLPNGFRVGAAFHRGIIKRGGTCRLVTFTPRTWDMPRDERVSQLLSQDFNLVIIPDMDTLGYDPEGKQRPYTVGDQQFTDLLYFRKAKKEMRAFWFMVNDLGKFLDSADVNYETLGDLSRRIEQEMGKAKGIRLISTNSYYGNEIHEVLELDTRKDCAPIADYNFEQHKLGEGCNLPFGEVLLTPNNKTGNGRVVVDGSFYGDTTVTMKRPMVLDFSKGQLVVINGGIEMQELMRYLEKEATRTRTAMKENPDISNEYLDNIYRIGEFAIGVNPKATFCDDILIDEKVYGSAHIALGRSYHGDPAFSHVDLVIRKPKVVFTYPDGTEKTIVDNGQILL